MCIISLFDGVEAARPDLRYPPFSLTKIRRGRAFATCSLPQYGQIPAAGALLVTSRQPSGTASSGLAPLPIFHVAACGSSLVVCLNRISVGVLSILQSRPQTIFDKPPCAIFPILHGTCFFFVGVCVFNSCYWAVIVSFRPPFVNRAIHFHLVAIVTFCWTAQITFLKSVLCSSPKCHTGNIFTFLWDCEREIGFAILLIQLRS